MALETADTHSKESLPASRGIARVHIYGAGIAGLTAAHELAIRGFRVRVIEPAQESNELGQLEGAPAPLDRRMAVGGRARTQFLRAARGAEGNFQAGTEGERSEEFRLFLEYPADFEPGGPAGTVPEVLLGRIHHYLNRCGFFTRGETQGVLHIRIPPSPDAERQRRRQRNAEALHTFLTARSPWETKLEPARVIIMEEAEARELARCLAIPPLELQPQEGLWLELLHLLPGEHGFRFFPSYSRHLFSTMLQTPLLDANNQLTGRRVFDNLVPSSAHGIGAQGRRLRFLRRTPSTRPIELLQELRDVSSPGYPQSDTAQFTLRVWRYLCTSSERRKAECEQVSWWEYLEGYDPKKDTRRYQYSATFKRDMQLAPRLPAAFDSAWGDAHTHGNTLTQLYLNDLLPLPGTDGTLNGPTTLAWLRPWRRYLEELLGVEFHAGELTRLELDAATGELKPFWKRRGETHETQDTEVLTPAMEAGFPDVVEKVDYHLIATDAATAERLTKHLEPATGVIQGLRGFTTQVPARPRSGKPEQPRTPGVFPGSVPWDRFQTRTGIQFFFPASVRLAEGYLYFLDTPWGLSAIHSQQYWATPPTLDRDGFGAVLSVYIGNWFLREEGQKGPSDSSRQELAQEVWKQLKKASEEHRLPQVDVGRYDFALPEPVWYHLDRYLRFKSVSDKEQPEENGAPYLIPIAGDWNRRPGTEPWDPLHPGPPPVAPTEPGLWQAEHGGYLVHWDKLVFAGTYLKTFTRLTSMEAANESARHAVNAIIDHYLFQNRGYYPPPPPRRQITDDRHDELGPLGGLPELRMTPIGEYCRIWDPEQHELPELASLRELDAKLLAAGRPHVWDVLHLESLALPFVQQPMGTPPGAEPLLELLRKVREGLEALLKGATSGMR